MVHSDHKLAIFDVNLLCVELGAVVVVGPTIGHVPPRQVQGVEFLSPTELKILSLHIVIVRHNIVIARSPRHRAVVKIVPPAIKGRRPEVHG